MISNNPGYGFFKSLCVNIKFLFVVLMLTTLSADYAKADYEVYDIPLNTLVYSPIYAPYYSIYNFPVPDSSAQGSIAMNNSYFIQLSDGSYVDGLYIAPIFRENSIYQSLPFNYSLIAYSMFNYSVSQYGQSVVFKSHFGIFKCGTQASPIEITVNQG